MSARSQALVPLSTEQQAAWRAVAETEKRRHQGNTLAEYPYACAFFRCLNGSRRIAASYRPPARFCNTIDNPLHSASQPILDPLHHPLIYPILPQLCYKDVMGDSIKSLTEIKVDYMYRPSPCPPS